MPKIPKFQIYGLNDKNIEEEIQPKLTFRGWCQLEQPEKEIALQQLTNSGWLDEYGDEILKAIKHLNHNFLRECPGKHLHNTKPKNDQRYNNDRELKLAALTDFKHLLLHDNRSEALILRMLTVFADAHIKKYYLDGLESEKESDQIKEQIDEAFNEFDKLANCLNHIFEQFAVNIILTRNGIIPRQENKINQYIYEPTLKILSNPKWKTINDDLSEMFSDYHLKNYPETITKAHRVVQRFLQIIAGEEGKNSRGELAVLFKKAKEQKLIPINRFTEPIIDVFKSYIPTERATKSTAKPAKESADAEDALLIMNVVMVFLQFCLQKNK